jgi:hypothetical protein
VVESNASFPGIDLYLLPPTFSFFNEKAVVARKKAAINPILMKDIGFVLFTKKKNSEINLSRNL